MSVIVNNLTKTYGSQKAIDSLSFEVKQGEILGFLGPNGAGKSTTMKILTGYLSATEGDASVCGFDVATQSMEVKKKIGYLPEHNPLYLEMYIKEFLAFMARIYGVENKERTQEVIELVGLDREHHKKIGQLSKGYRQRVGLAHAIYHDPEVLILDEPTTGLDPNQLVEIRKLIKTVGENKTVMLSTHIMQEVENICDRVVILSRGLIKLDAKVSELTQSGQTMEDVFLKYTA
ncbi:protein involved in gliding motility GldA [Spirosomataceae bacterium TFI 002]|nr:protein involved in gliding motility GldA [Spirosomataceae bacterium TFI 002]